MVALLLDPLGPELALGIAALDRLADLGIARLSVFRDDGAILVVLEGWAFDSARAATARAVVSSLDRPARILRQVNAVSILADPQEGTA
jgi:hypothetical protein